MTPVIGIMRFNVVSASYSRAFAATRDVSIETALERILDPSRLAKRVALLKSVPIASLAAQTDPDFTLCLLIAKKLPDRFKQELAQLQDENSFIRLVEVDVDDDIMNCMRGLVSQAPTITFRLDDDDAVGRNHVADLRELAAKSTPQTILTMPEGVYLEAEGRHLLMQEVSYPNNAFGIGSLADDGLTIFHRGTHQNLDQHPIVKGHRRMAWLRSIHAGSDSGTRINRNKPFLRLTPDKAGAALPGYDHIDFASLHQGLDAYERPGLVTRLKRRARRVLGR